ncbi:MAG: serine/threonine protein kinase [Paenibacillaceae bacterium]|nr:serine/threonine protein kinase [Paenibacillaceae bacterium]
MVGVWACGTVIAGRYRIVRPLGSGGMGAVYVVADVHDAVWACKCIARHDEAMHEAAMMRRVTHRAFPKLVDVCVHAGMTCLMMTLIDGRSLSDIVAQQCLDVAAVVALADALSDALSALHCIGIVHRDVKPAHVLYDAQGCIHLVDFGICRTVKPWQLHDTVHVGTLAFAAPEQRAMHQTDARTDVYALGCVLLYALTGRYYALDASRTIAALPPMRTEMRTLLLEMVSEHRAQRPADARDVRKRLAEVHDCAPVWDGTTRIVAVHKLFPGAGATVIAHAIADVLRADGANVVSMHGHAHRDCGAPWTVLDVAQSWPCVATLRACTVAHVVVVAPDAHQLATEESVRAWHRWHHMPIAPFWVANRVPAHRYRASFLSLFPVRPVACIAEVDCSVQVPTHVHRALRGLVRVLRSFFASME